MTLLEELNTVLKTDERLVSDNKLLKNIIVELALKLDKELIKLLLSKEKIREHFFIDVNEVLVFDREKFMKFIDNKGFLPDSYTTFKNKIGLTTSGRFISKNNKVVLSWPYKDCVLEGGQEKEDEKRKEIFYNKTLAPDEIDRLLAPKVFTSFKRINAQGEHNVTEIKSTDNLIIRGNNLLALHSIKKKYSGQIKLVYIDPPYNIGTGTFLYNDKFNHSTWLTFMKNRLEVAWILLRNDGSIFISIDHNELGHLKVLMDEIFGVENLKNIVTVQRSAISGPKVINPGLVNVSEFILIYSKSKDWDYNRIFRERKYDTRYNKFILNIEEDYEKWVFCSVLDAFSKQINIPKSQLKKKLGIEYNDKVLNFVIDHVDRIIRFALLDENSISKGASKIKNKSLRNPDKMFLYKREKYEDYFIKNGQVVLFYKNRVMEIDDKITPFESVSNIWFDVLPNDLAKEGGVTFRKGKKPEKLIKRILDLSTNEKDIVLDFFIGSGTTCAVAHKMNRQYLGFEQIDYGKNDVTVRLNNVIKNKDSSGITKTSKWRGGGQYVYCELKKLNEVFIEKIRDAMTDETLLKIWEGAKENSFLSYRVVEELFDDNIDDFKKLSLKEKKRILLECFELNKLYVNYSEIEDDQYGVSESDVRLNKIFYGDL